nr:pyridoxamine 5'-phosphate oxidase family protein [Cytophagales bacterium]
MGKKIPCLSPELIDFIRDQRIFFVGTAATEGRVNVSPKGMDTFRVIDAGRVVWMNLTGSGNETAAHLSLSDRMTIMFCAFDGKPLILRLYGTAGIYHPGEESFEKYATLFPRIPGSRQIIDMSIDLVQTSCGFAVPLMDFREERDILSNWAEKKGADGIRAYWQEKNLKSIDGFDTGMGTASVSKQGDIEGNR